MGSGDDRTRHPENSFVYFRVETDQILSPAEAKYGNDPSAGRNRGCISRFAR